MRASAREADFEEHAAKAKAKRCRKDNKSEAKAQPKKRTKRAAKEESDVGHEKQDEVPTEKEAAASASLSTEPEGAVVAAELATGEAGDEQDQKSAEPAVEGVAPEKAKRVRKARVAPTKEAVKAAWALKERCKASFAPVDAHTPFC